MTTVTRAPSPQAACWNSARGSELTKLIVVPNQRTGLVWF